ncbi:DUF1127 domain-containing protein [Metapseudomonas otitidis]|uniref:YjiS-like domain-containing protein n=1 Tax=Metapseudomonas otitidis TaxID=319939 RepID=A0A1I0SM67_9GAMM|nr:DUF1127 domain-containing protein [Pseudomonas otitidis]BCA26455.1 hypothetical protein PtoMrB4_04320 [Pseudomonas otitidis]SFA40582.1 protein of unknown function [Pseudomonas otitidis]
MSGLSDVRLTLHPQELIQAGERAATSVRLSGSPWQRFWLRLSTRKALLELDEHALKDIGLTRAQALEEGLKPFWRG